MKTKKAILPIKKAVRSHHAKPPDPLEVLLSEKKRLAQVRAGMFEDTDLIDKDIAEVERKILEWQTSS